VNEKKDLTTPFRAEFVTTEKGKMLQILMLPSEVHYLATALIDTVRLADLQLLDTDCVTTLLGFCAVLIPDENQYVALAEMP
jgi:hypothetical protein